MQGFKWKWASDSDSDSGGLAVRFISKCKMMRLMFHFCNQALIQHLDSFLSRHTVQTHWPKLSIDSLISTSHVFFVFFKHLVHAQKVSRSMSEAPEASEVIHVLAQLLALDWFY